MQFVNRHEELAFLNRYSNESGFQFVPLYGRRRVGKTRLVQEFLHGKRAVYFMADSVSEREQLKNLGREVGELFCDIILVESGFRDWQQFFAYISEKSRSERMVLVIDEFPYLVYSNSAISTIFQKGIDTRLKETNVFLVLMGSSIGMMEQEVLFSKAPLYGRRTASLEVREMEFSALEEFFPGLSLEYRVGLYAIFGAIPAYLERINPDETPLENVRRLVLDRGSFLYSEVEFLLREELREPRNYFVILRAIAQGKRKLSEIINDTGFDKNHLSRYLDILRTLRLVDKDIPVTERYPDKSRMGLYCIHDYYVSFWFRSVFPFRGRLELGNIDYVADRIARGFDQLLGTVYEKICRELCKQFMVDGAMQFSVIGKWWNRSEEIDLVALDEEESTAWFGECKWSVNKVGIDIFRSLKEKATQVEWRKQNRRDKYILFSRSGFTDEMQKLASADGVMLVHGDKLGGMMEKDNHEL
jgi:AAA+ ATPase superfamily predicted ATPase